MDTQEVDWSTLIFESLHIEKNLTSRPCSESLKDMFDLKTKINNYMVCDRPRMSESIEIAFYNIVSDHLKCINRKIIVLTGRMEDYIGGVLHNSGAPMEYDDLWSDNWPNWVYEYDEHDDIFL